MVSQVSSGEHVCMYMSNLSTPIPTFPMPSQKLCFLFPVRSCFSSPPTFEIHCSRVDTKILECLCRKMAVIWSLNAGIWIIAFCVCLHTIQGQAHDLCKQLADLIFCVVVFGRELEYGRQSRFVFSLEVFNGDVWKRLG